MMGIEFLPPPFLFLLAGVVLLPLLFNGALRAWLFPLFALLALISIWTLPSDILLTLPYGNYELILYRSDALSRSFGTVFAFIALAGGVYSIHMRELRQQLAAMLYASGTLGVIFAGDYFSLLIFWEMMAIGSTFLVWSNRTPQSDAAGMRYLLFHLMGGAFLMVGIILRFSETGSLVITSIAPEQASIGSWMIFLGVAVNAAMVPLHAWVPDAYSRASATGSVFLSAFTTKTAVYVFLRIFPGWEILIWAGLIMALYGVFYALLSDNIRSLLSYHIVCQVGYMLVAVGIGGEFGTAAATAHAVSNVLFKTLLFMGAGAVLFATGENRLSQLGGLFREQKLTYILFMVGAFSIAGTPLFNGFTSKSLIIEATGREGLYWVMMLLLLASVGTFLSITLKLAYYTWMSERRSQLEVKKTPLGMHVSMVTVALLCFLFGVQPDLMYRFFPGVVDYNPWNAYHLMEIIQIQVLAFGAFWLIRKKLLPHRATTLDLDFFYRKPVPFYRAVTVGVVNYIFDAAERLVAMTASWLGRFGANPLRVLSIFTYHSPTYSADSYRKPMSIMLGVALLAFIFIAALGIVVSHGRF